MRVIRVVLVGNPGLVLRATVVASREIPAVVVAVVVVVLTGIVVLSSLFFSVEVVALVVVVGGGGASVVGASVVGTLGVVIPVVLCSVRFSAVVVGVVFVRVDVVSGNVVVVVAAGVGGLVPTKT